MSSGMGTAPQLLSAPTPIWYPARTTVQWTGGSSLGWAALSSSSGV